MQAGPSGLPPVDGSLLCLACGLCCQGLLHDWASLHDHEVEAARRLGLHTEKHADGTAFALPCPCHRDGRCTVYEERLSPCRDYCCKLLNGYQSGRVSLDEGLGRVQRAAQLVAAVRDRLGSSNGGVWQQIRTAEPGTLDGADARLDVAALLAYCQRHFWNRPRTMGRAMEAPAS